jgi:hypothetical protein
MAKITVIPEKFNLVYFDSGRIAELAAEVAEVVGLPADFEIRIEVDEVSPLGRTTLTSLEPATVMIEGGAFENAKKPRHMSDDDVRGVLGRMFYRIRDRVLGGFGDAPPDEQLDLQQQTAWDAYAVGRTERAGLTDQKPRRQYHFRNRHGFSDAADAVFERLWRADALTWSDIEAACAETAAARQSVAP